jgi:lipoate-protein ligase A
MDGLDETEARDATLRWRLIVDEEASSGSRNMALDHALAECLEPGEGVVRLYRWDPPTISFGRNEPSRDRYDRARAEREGFGFVRRPTGGRAVLHDAEVTYAVVAPLRALGGLREAYEGINRGLVAGLREVGVRAQVEAGGVVLAPDAGPCFQVPAPGEVTVGGRKLVGSAQVRLGGALLQHGSVILRGDQGAVTRLSGGGEDPAPPATVAELIDDGVDDAAVTAALADGLRLALGGIWNEGAYRSWEKDVADRLEGDRYAREDWTWRR